MTYVPVVIILAACVVPNSSRWEESNPVVVLPKPPLGISSTFAELPHPPTPERVRLGRWLFYDTRLSADNTVSCATCHAPQNAFSEPLPTSKGIRGQIGSRKAPSFVNLAWTLYPHFFWDGRAASLEDQAKGPIANPIEMGNSHEAVVKFLRSNRGYRRYFRQAFRTEEITIDHVAQAIADYERTRLSGNSLYDRHAAGQTDALSPQAKKGIDLFFDKAECNQCHLGQNFTDSLFHNLGVGWNAKTKTFSDRGRVEISKKPEDLGAFKTPMLRDVAKHAPFMHDGSMKTLNEVVEHYNQGGIKNPTLSPKIRPLHLSKDEVDAIVVFLESLNGEGYQDTAPRTFPQ